MSFTDRKTFIADAKFVERFKHAFPGLKRAFFCGICGKDIKAGDSVRLLFTNFKGSKVPGNPFVCTPCDKGDEENIKVLESRVKELKQLKRTTHRHAFKCIG